jgi:hypothetical protein
MLAESCHSGKALVRVIECAMLTHRNATDLNLIKHKKPWPPPIVTPLIAKSAFTMRFIFNDWDR